MSLKRLPRDLTYPEFVLLVHEEGCLGDCERHEEVEAEWAKQKDVIMAKFERQRALEAKQEADRHGARDHLHPLCAESAMKQEPYKFWCSECKVVHGGECPPKAPPYTGPAKGSQWIVQVKPFGKPWRDSSAGLIYDVRGVGPLGKIQYERVGADYSGYELPADAWTPEGTELSGGNRIRFRAVS